jgi:hypothetical protein
MRRKSNVKWYIIIYYVYSHHLSIKSVSQQGRDLIGRPKTLVYLHKMTN